MGFTLYSDETEKIYPVFFISNKETEFIDYINNYISERFNFNYYYLYSKRKKEEKINTNINEKIEIISNKDIIFEILTRSLELNRTREIKENGFYFNNTCYRSDICSCRSYICSCILAISPDTIHHISNYQYFSPFLKNDIPVITVFKELKTFPEIYKERLINYK